MSQNREEAELLPRKDRYNRSNPPSEINEAQERLDELDGTIAHIETQWKVPLSSDNNSKILLV